MMNRRIALWSAIAMLACAPALAGAEEMARFTFTVPDAPESTLHPDDGRFELTLQRWSTDEERDRVHAAFKDPDHNPLLQALRDVPAIGYLEWAGGLEYPVRYARRVERADGGHDLVLLVDRAMWVWWNDTLAPYASQAPWTVLQVRVPEQGMGEGRAAFGASVVTNQEAGITVTDFADRPVVLQDVRAEGEAS